MLHIVRTIISHLLEAINCIGPQKIDSMDHFKDEDNESRQTCSNLKSQTGSKVSKYKHVSFSSKVFSVDEIDQIDLPYSSFISPKVSGQNLEPISCLKNNGSSKKILFYQKSQKKKPIEYLTLTQENVGKLPVVKNQTTM